MKVHPLIFIPTIIITIHTISNCEPEPQRKKLIINEIKVSQGGEGHFIELKAEEVGIDLSGYHVVVLDYSRERQLGNRERLKVKGILNLNGKQLTGNIGFIGESIYFKNVQLLLKEYYCKELMSLKIPQLRVHG